MAYVREADGWKHASDLDVRPACIAEVKRSNVSAEKGGTEKNSGPVCFRRETRSAPGRIFFVRRLDLWYRVVVSFHRKVLLWGGRDR